MILKWKVECFLLLKAAVVLLQRQRSLTWQNWGALNRGDFVMSIPWHAAITMSVQCSEHIIIAVIKAAVIVQLISARRRTGGIGSPTKK
jgi:hypothetical protein